MFLLFAVGDAGAPALSNSAPGGAEDVAIGNTDEVAIVTLPQGWVNLEGKRYCSFEPVTLEVASSSLVDPAIVTKLRKDLRGLRRPPRRLRLYGFDPPSAEDGAGEAPSADWPLAVGHLRPCTKSLPRHRAHSFH
jgi:hypothetical protein